MIGKNQEQCNVYMDSNIPNQNTQEGDRFIGIISINTNQRNQRNRRNRRNTPPIQQNRPYHTTGEIPNLLEQHNSSYSISLSNKYVTVIKPNNNVSTNISDNISNNINIKNNIIKNEEEHNKDNDDDDKILSENLFDLELEDNKKIEEIIEEIKKGNSKEEEDYSNFDIFDYSKMPEDEVELLKRKRQRRRRKK